MTIFCALKYVPFLNLQNWLNGLHFVGTMRKNREKENLISIGLGWFGFKC